MFTKFRILSALLVMFISSSAFAELAIIGHPDYDTGELDTFSVKRLFLGDRKSFPNGLHAEPINHAEGSPDRKVFFSTVLSMVEASHSRHWTRKRAKGAGNSPVEVNSHEEVLRYVSETPGGISYIDASLVDDSVKVLFTVSNFDDV